MSRVMRLEGTEKDRLRIRHGVLVVLIFATSTTSVPNLTLRSITQLSRFLVASPFAVIWFFAYVVGLLVPKNRSRRFETSPIRF